MTLWQTLYGTIMAQGIIGYEIIFNKTEYLNIYIKLIWHNRETMLYVGTTDREEIEVGNIIQDLMIDIFNETIDVNSDSNDNRCFNISSVIIEAISEI